MPKSRLIAYYLPQFHPIPENDLWWGKGFTEWTNVTKARSFYAGHYQPNLPTELGFYDLRLPEVRQQQADLAHEYGLEGFCYWHYWFGGGRRILERTFAEVLSSGEPKFPFCLAWANETWRGIQYGANNGATLIEQTYPGLEDFQAHFAALLPAFRDKRYITVDGNPLFVVYMPHKLPNAQQFIELWRGLANKSGLAGLHLVGLQDSSAWNPLEHGFDAVIPHEPWQHFKLMPQRAIEKLVRIVAAKSFTDVLRNRFKIPAQYDYREFVQISFQTKMPDKTYPCVIPNWDTTPRTSEWGVVLNNSSPELFAVHLDKAIQMMHDAPADRKIIFIKSWNEWAEGNYLEPDRRFGRGYLEALKKCMDSQS